MREVTVLDPERVRVVHLLTTDVVSTVGSVHEATVTAEVSRALEFTESAEEFAQKLADDVQQVLHDTFVDTTWPACPRHRLHPLWYRDGSWWCEVDGETLARLGELPVRRAAG